MTVSGKVVKQINSIQEGTTFKYQQLDIKMDEYNAAAKAIERLIERQIIKRVSTGVFYKPKKTEFGELRPKEEEIIKPYLFVKNKRIAYITGTALYNQMGLTTQVPNTIKIASKGKRISIKTGNIQAKPVKSYIDVTNDNFYLLELLDVLKDFKIIPDLDKKMAIKYILNKLEALSDKDKLRLMKFAIQYPPRTSAFLGALLGNMNTNLDLKILKQNLNPLTDYKLGIKENQLSTAPNWNIK
ncbi:MAG: DUF6088 family protein [Bacteroidales bacterium]